MPEPRFRLLVTGPARRDIAAIIRWSLKDFGAAAASRYEALIFTALRDIRDDPHRPGSRELPEIMIPGARTYHLSFSRSRTAGATVKSPRHIILYRIAAQSTIEVARILHDTRDLVQHLPEEYRR